MSATTQYYHTWILSQAKVWFWCKHDFLCVAHSCLITLPDSYVSHPDTALSFRR
jgi:hypothetical protein